MMMSCSEKSNVTEDGGMRRGLSHAVETIVQPQFGVDLQSRRRDDGDDGKQTTRRKTSEHRPHVHRLQTHFHNGLSYRHLPYLLTLLLPTRSRSLALIRDLFANGRTLRGWRRTEVNRIDVVWSSRHGGSATIAASPKCCVFTQRFTRNLWGVRIVLSLRCKTFLRLHANRIAPTNSHLAATRSLGQ